jgi:rubredoxin
MWPDGGGTSEKRASACTESVFQLRRYAANDVGAEQRAKPDCDARGWWQFVTTTETQTKQLWMCTSCGFIYDPDEGDPDGGIPPGTPFEEIPDSWFCPVCGARKADFEPYED